MRLKICRTTPRSQRRDLGHPLMVFGFMEAVLFVDLYSI
jgi:hypothetical protein